MNTEPATGAARPFRIYRSSAGSGKTYTLAREYLALALRSPDQFGQILAVTFTNKATREMKDRILRFLEELRDGRSPELAAHFSSLLGLDPADLRQRATQLLGNILHRYDEFAVSTIDAFFQRIVRAFARELGLLGNFAVELDEEKVRHLVVELTLASAGSDQRLTEWLAEYVDRNLQESRNWDVRKEVGELAREVFGERFKRLEDQVLQHPDGENAIPNFRRDLKGAKAIYEQQVKKLAGAGIDLIRSSGLEISDFKQGIRGPAAYFGKAVDKPGELPGSYTRHALADPAEWASKSSPQRARIIQLVDGGLMECLHRLVGFQERHARRYNSLNAALAEIYTFGILTDFVKKIAQYRDEEDVMLISDVNQFLLKIIRDSPAPFIYEKTGTRFRHFLIDEFQDTSGFQWECLLPLVLNSLAEYHTNLVVGDVKQSIYRWRDGDWNLLARRLEEDIRPEYTHTESLNTNWRSSGRIVRFNNQLFRPDALPGLLASRYRQVAAEAGEDAGEFERLYADAVQQMPAGMPERLDHGCVRIGFSAQDGKTEDWQARVLELLPTRIQGLLAQGYRSSDIAVLVRRKSEGAEVVKRLIAFRNEDEYRSGLPYEVVSNESLLLGNAPVVRLLIHALESLHRPDDRLALLNLAATACEIAGGKAGELTAVLKADPSNPLDAWIPEDFLSGRDELRSQALPHLIEALIRLFGLSEDSAHLPWLQAFQDAVLAFTDDHPQDLGQLLEWWNAEGSSRALQIPGDLEALQVMTIHKAKGLEFKVVLLPFCRWSLNHSAGAGPVLWCSSTEPPFHKCPCSPCGTPRGWRIPFSARGTCANTAGYSSTISTCSTWPSPAPGSCSGSMPYCPLRKRSMRAS
jgi:ATP-dependent helicase/nuclease subunit A